MRYPTENSPDASSKHLVPILVVGLAAAELRDGDLGNGIVEFSTCACMLCENLGMVGEVGGEGVTSPSSFSFHGLER